MRPRMPVARRGFTVVELLVVIAIIGVLAAIVLVAGGKVLSGGKKNATQDVIRMLDTSLEAYIAAKDELPDATMNIPVKQTDADANPQTSLKQVPMADAKNGDKPASMDSTADIINTVGLFMLQASQRPESKAHLDGIPAKFVRKHAVLGNIATTSTDWQIPTVFDAWNRPIRFVHPSWHGLRIEPGTPATGIDFVMVPGDNSWAMTGIRRNNVATAGAIADSDGGVCTGKHPYFYSSGEVGDPSTTADNVYTTVPGFTVN